MNLNRLRENNFLERSIEIYNENPDRITFPDQCLINIYANGKKLLLDTSLNRYVRSKEMTLQQWNEIKNKTKIFHFIEKIKPWHEASRIHVAEFWWSYAKLTGNDTLQPLKCSSIHEWLYKSRSLEEAKKYEESCKIKDNIINYLLASRKKIRPQNIWGEILRDDVPIENKFKAIYKYKLWGNGESPSGYGSSLAYTKNLRSALPKLIKELKIKILLDAPCGDLNWMKHLLPTLDVKYIGGDIVEELINHHKKVYSNPTTNFLHLDLTKDRLPNADLMICRDCLFHLSYQDIKKVLQNFVDSNIPYLLTTTHITQTPNQDIKTGGFRLINLFEAPFHFDKNPLARIDDWMEPEAERQMCLWTRLQIINAIKRMGNSLIVRQKSQDVSPRSVRLSQ